MLWLHRMIRLSAGLLDMSKPALVALCYTIYLPHYGKTRTPVYSAPSLSFATGGLGLVVHLSEQKKIIRSANLNISQALLSFIQMSDIQCQTDVIQWMKKGNATKTIP
jgi:hypothetical protein